MSYQVLARKWRPRSFTELVGQEHVVRALSNALDNDRVHHAYLFTGTRGVGKTTLARILAKSLNCESGVSSTPCGVCTFCREIDEGRFVDLIEVDAASRTKVDQTRELLENVPYAPASGRYKVYLIDEVHMFSDSSFNALLKTLEEPPPHVKFLLATTDPQKVPVTVLSRCLQFNLKRIPLDQIQGQLKHILGSEKVFSDDEALLQLSIAADGSMRDALSLLDQAIAFGGGQVREADIRAMLGTVPQDYIRHVFDSLVNDDAVALMEHINEMAQQSVDFTTLLKTLLISLHRIALLQHTKVDASEDSSDLQHLGQYAESFTHEDIQLYYQMALMGQNDLNLAPDPRMGFEMLMLRLLAFKPSTSDNSDTQINSQATKAKSSPQKPAASSPQKNTAAAKKVDATPSAPITSRDWTTVVSELKLGGLSGQFAGHCAVKSWDDKKLVLMLNPKHQSLKDSRAETMLVKTLEDAFKDTKIEILVGESEKKTPEQVREQHVKQKQSKAVDDIAADPYVEAMKQKFDAEVIKESIKPI